MEEEGQLSYKKVFLEVLFRNSVDKPLMRKNLKKDVSATYASIIRKKADDEDIRSQNEIYGLPSRKERC